MTYPHAALEAADDTLKPHLPDVGVLEVARNHLHGVTVLLSNATAAAELARALGIPDSNHRREHHPNYVTDTWRGHLGGVPVTVHATTLTYTDAPVGRVLTLPQRRRRLTAVPPGGGTTPSPAA